MHPLDVRCKHAFCLFIFYSPRTCLLFCSNWQNAYIFISLLFTALNVLRKNSKSFILIVQLQGKVQLLSLEALHQLHIFIFVLAVTHVVFSATTMVLGGARVKFGTYCMYRNLPNLYNDG